MSDVDYPGTSSDFPRDHCVYQYPSSIEQNFCPSHVRFAKKLHESAFIYALYGALDGLSLSYSMVKYGCDVLNTPATRPSSDLMHEWMVTPAGSLATGMEAMTLIAFSFIANTCSDDDPNAFKQFVAAAWPYLRDVLKGLKNAYKGIRSTLLASSVFFGQDLNLMIVPLGLALGGVSVLNRIWYRTMRDTRKDMMQTNDEILENIKKYRNWPPENCLIYTSDEPPESKNLSPYLKEGTSAYVIYQDRLFYINKTYGICKSLSLAKKDLNIIRAINPKNTPKVLNQEQLLKIEEAALFKHQTIERTLKEQRAFLKSNRYKGLVSQFFSGFIDGLYLYMGVLGITLIAPQLFAGLAALSVVFTLACMVSRVYEEHNYQKKLKQSQMKIELAVCGKELEQLCFQTLLELVDKSNGKSSDQANSLAIQKFEEKYQAFLKQRISLAESLVLSTSSAALTGLQYGLSAYGALASLLFAAATLHAIFLTPVSAALVLGTAGAGLAFVIGFTVFAIYKNWQHTQHHQAMIQEEPECLAEIKKKVLEVSRQTHKDVANIPSSVVNQAILEGMVVDPSPQFFFQEMFEVVRSFFSGMSKGQKSVNYTFNSFQKQDEQGHYREAPFMLILTVASATLYSIVLALRALARGFGKKKLGEASLGPVPKKSVSLKQAPDQNPLRRSASSEGFFSRPTRSNTPIPSTVKSNNSRTLFSVETRPMSEPNLNSSGESGFQPVNLF